MDGSKASGDRDPGISMNEYFGVVDGCGSEVSRGTSIIIMDERSS